MNDNGSGDGERAAMRALWRSRGEVWNRSAPAAISDNAFDRAMIEAASIAPGESVLDLASGAGDPAIGIALHVGSEGSLVASDFAGEMLAGTIRRAARLDLAQLRCVVSDMEALPFATASFDVVSCRLGVMFATDRAAAAAEACRVLRPGGRAVYLVWGPEGDHTIHRHLRTTVMAHLGEPPGPVSRRHALGAPGALGALLEGAGFDRVEEREVCNTRLAPADKLFWTETLERNYCDRMAALDKESRRSLDDALRAAYAPYRDGEVYRLNLLARVGVGIKAG